MQIHQSLTKSQFGYNTPFYFINKTETDNTSQIEILNAEYNLYNSMFHLKIKP